MMLITAPNLPPPLPEWASVAVTSPEVVAPPLPPKIALGAPPLAYVYDAGNSITIERLTNRPPQSYRPRTVLGAKLLALRNAYIEDGGELLSMEELDLALRARRGELDDD